MVVEPKGAKKIVVPPVQIVLGQIPLSRKMKTEPRHARLQINGQLGMENNVQEVKRKTG